MRITTGMLILNIVLLLAVCAVFGYLIFLVIKALRKYIRSEPIRKEKIVKAKTLGEVLKKHRIECKMTQEFVAEALGVSRQAVSKWSVEIEPHLMICFRCKQAGCVQMGDGKS